MKSDIKRRIVIVIFAVIIILLVAFFLTINYLSHRFYPLEYTEEIKTNALEYSLEPAQVCAIIYEESKFDPDVVSSRDAIGLMQILPDTANFIAKDLGYERLLRDDLFVPNNNIRFGTYYFKFLLDRYNGNLDLALAAYNAGFGAVDKAGGNINNLPEETREFVSRVKKTKKVYITLYANKLEVSDELFKKEHLSYIELSKIVIDKLPNKESDE